VARAYTLHCQGVRATLVEAIAVTPGIARVFHRGSADNAVGSTRPVCALALTSMGDALPSKRTHPSPQPREPAQRGTISICPSRWPSSPRWTLLPKALWKVVALRNCRLMASLIRRGRGYLARRMSPAAKRSESLVAHMARARKRLGECLSRSSPPARWGRGAPLHRQSPPPRRAGRGCAG